MDLKDLLISKGKENITIGDRFYARCLDDYIKLNSLKEYMTPEELNNYSRTLGSELGKICEYYLKGLLFPNLELTIPKSDDCLQSIENQLTDEQRYRLIIGDNSIIDEIFNQYKNLRNLQKRYF